MVKIPTEVPPVSDSTFWIPLARQVLPFLSRKAKTWAEMKAWAKTQKMKQEVLRNTVAWCEIQGLAYDATNPKRIAWRASPGWKREIKSL